MSPASERSAGSVPEAVGGSVPEAAGGSVPEVFARHLADGGAGMAFAAYRHGRVLHTLAGGRTEAVRAGEAGTPVDGEFTSASLAVLFSGTKALSATLLGLCVDDGLIDITAPVARYWPEFAAAGKEQVPVSRLFDHTLGLPYVDPDPVGEEADDFRLMAARLAAQRPLWEPGTQVAYHALTYGYLASELIGRVTGAQLGELLAERITGPHGLDIHLGLPAALEPRVSPIRQAADYRISTFLHDPQRRAIIDRMYAPLLTGDPAPYNTRAYHAAGQGAGGGIGTAESMARFYALLLEDGAILSAGTRELFTRTWSEGLDALNDRPLHFGVGFELADPIGTYGPVGTAFGHSGAGGGRHGAWPELGVTFSFLPTEMQAEDVDTRAADLLAALYAEVTGAS